MRKLFSPLGLQYSVKKFIEDSTDIQTELRRDGMTLPSKPYMIVTELPSTSYQLSKGKEAVQTKHALQVDMYGESKRDISDMHKEVRDLMMFGRFDYYTEDGVKTDLQLEFDDEIIESPVFSDEYTKESNHHSMHIGADVYIVRHRRLK